MTDFDLHALVRSVNDGSSFANPRDFAEKVAENVPSKALREALAEALVPFCRIFWQQQRSVVTPMPSARNSARSSKSRAIREAWRRTLAGHFHIGDGAWLPLAECSYENVCYLAAERHENARRSTAVGAMFDGLAEAMKEHGVGRAGELPESVLAQILTTEDVAA